MLLRRLPHAGKIGKLQVNVVKKIGDIMVGKSNRFLVGRFTSTRRSRFVLQFFNREFADDLRLAIVEKLKIFFFQSASCELISLALTAVSAVAEGGAEEVVV
jgi:hypothetical protein